MDNENERRLLRSEIVEGLEARDVTLGAVTLCGSSRYIRGGYIVDVVATLWDGSIGTRTAALCNLRVSS